MLKYYLSFQSPQKGYKDQVISFTSHEHNNLIVLPIDFIFGITLYGNNMLYLNIKQQNTFGIDVYSNIWLKPTEGNNWESVLEVLTAWRFIRPNPKGMFDNLWNDWQYACRFQTDLHPQYLPGIPQ